MNNEEAKTQILMNFGPVGGGEIHQQNIYTGTAPQPTGVEGNAQERVEQLSISQLAILFEATLGVTYSSEYNNVNAIARLIAAVSGYKQGSVRQKLIKMSYESTQSAADRERVATLIEKLSPKLADKIRENV